MKRFFFIIVLVVSLLLPSCRVKRNVQTSEHSSYSNVERLEFRRLDSLWNSLSETTKLRIEFYPVDDSPTTDTVQADADASKSSTTGKTNSGISHGAVKSVEIVSTTEITSMSTTEVDSVVSDSVSAENDRCLAKQTAAGHDYGWWIIIAVAVALAIFFYFKFFRL